MDLRKEFEITKNYTYLNTAATSPLPTYVLDAITAYLQSRAQLGECAWDVWMEKVLKAREICATLIGASRGEVSFLKNTGEGLNTACAMMPCKGNVVTTDAEFPSNYLPWSRRYRDLRTVEQGREGFDLNDFEKAIDDDTVAVTFSEITYNMGSRLPTKEIAELAHDHGAYVISDAVQALGAVRMDVRDLGIDMLCCGGHKWLASPFGVGIFYVSSELLESFEPPYVGWMSLEDCEDFSIENKELAHSARRFEIGNLNISGIIGMSCSVETMLRYDVSKIEDEVTILASYLMDKLEGMGYDVLTPRNSHGGIVSVDIPDAETIVKDLLAKRIAVAHRDGVRISPHFWNTKQELDTFLDALPVI